MQDLNQLSGNTFQNGIFYLGLSADAFNFVCDDGRCELSYEHTDMNCENEATVYLITFTISENNESEDIIEENYFVNPETFDYAGYWHFEVVV